MGASNYSTLAIAEVANEFTKQMTNYKTGLKSDTLSEPGTALLLWYWEQPEDIRRNVQHLVLQLMESMRQRREMRGQTGRGGFGYAQAIELLAAAIAVRYFGRRC